MSGEKSFLGKTIAILGCGYIGCVMAKEAVKRGMCVTAITHNAEKIEALRNMGVQKTVKAEIEGREWHHNIPGRQDFVLNCIGSASPSVADYKKTYIQAQDSIMIWAMNANIGMYIYTGSTGVYSQKGDVEVDEKSEVLGNTERNKILLKSESLVYQSRKYFKEWFILRLAGIYGPRRHYWLDRLKEGHREFIGSGQFRLNLIHRDDACRAIWSCMETEGQQKSGLYNVVDDDPVYKKDLVHWLADALGVGRPSFSEYGEGETNRKISNLKIKQNLGWKPECPSFREGFAEIGLQACSKNCTSSEA